MIALCVLFPFSFTSSFQLSPPSSFNSLISSLPSSRLEMAKKKNKNQQAQQDLDNFNNWYDKVDEDATPDEVFWEHMERQKLYSQTSDQKKEFNIVDKMNALNDLSSPSSSSASPSQNNNMNNMNSQPNGSSSASSYSNNISQEKATDATLSSYAYAMVSDNFLDEDYLSFYEDANEVNGFDEEDIDLEEQNRQIDEEYASLFGEDSGDGEAKDKPKKVPSFSIYQETWDAWAQKELSDDESDDGDVFKFRDTEDSEYLLNDDSDETDDEKEEEEYKERLRNTISIYSQRLNNAMNNPNAKAFFSRSPDVSEGYDRMWVSAIDNACMMNLIGVFRNYGIQFADNFGDWEDSNESDKLIESIEDIASYKARKVYEVTGLPCIASRTSFEIEPVKVTNTANIPGMPVEKSPASKNPRIASGYRFNDCGSHIDHLVDALLPYSEPTRITRFRTCICFYNGDMEIFDYGECDVDLYFCNSLRTFIPNSHAINEMCKTLQIAFGLEYQKWLKKRVYEAVGYPQRIGKASLKLRDRVLKEGKVLQNDIIDVSAFMDSMVDVDLMDECGDELAQRLQDTKPTKILTAATTGKRENK